MTGSIKKMVKTMAVLATAEFFSFLIAFGLEDSIGVIIGSLGSFVNLYSLWYDIQRMVENGAVGRIWKRGYLGRYTFNAVLMLIGGLISIRNLFGVFLGLMNLRISIHVVFGGRTG